MSVDLRLHLTWETLAWLLLVTNLLCVAAWFWNKPPRNLWVWCAVLVVIAALACAIDFFKALL